MIRERIQPTEESNEDGDTPFIALTVCPEYHAAYKEATLKEYGLKNLIQHLNGYY